MYQGNADLYNRRVGYAQQRLSNPNTTSAERTKAKRDISYNKRQAAKASSNATKSAQLAKEARATIREMTKIVNPKK